MINLTENILKIVTHFSNNYSKFIEWRTKYFIELSEYEIYEL